MLSYTTVNNTDICVKDRQNEYDEKKMYICEANCDFEDFDSENQKIECKCQIKIKFPLISEIIINKEKRKKDKAKKREDNLEEYAKNKAKKYCRKSNFF